MSLTLIVLGATVALLLALLVWTLSDTRQQQGSHALSELKEGGRAHVKFLPQMRRALEIGDDEFLARTRVRGLRERVGRERRRVALSYLSGLRKDFEELIHISRAIAALSPEIGAAQEIDRLRLKVIFLCRYRIIWISLRAGLAPLPQISDLSNLLSGFSVRLEEAMKELGERAAMVAEMVSSPDRRRIHHT